MAYQKGQSDQFFQRYRYDADNRLIKVSSSRSGHDSEVDAKYFYYPTGELARVELGEDQVQGIDYAYTIQGWLKAMNGSSIGDENNRGNFDMGEDARQASNNLHQRFGADAAAYTLGYYQGDYKSIAPNPAIANMPPQYSTDLYNGNISYKINSLSNLSGQPLDVQSQHLPIRSAEPPEKLRHLHRPEPVEQQPDHQSSSRGTATKPATVTMPMETSPTCNATTTKVHFDGPPFLSLPQKSQWLQ